MIASKGFVALIPKNTTCSGYDSSDHHYGLCSTELMQQSPFAVDPTGSPVRDGAVLRTLGNQTMLVQYAQYDLVH